MYEYAQQKSDKLDCYSRYIFYNLNFSLAAKDATSYVDDMPDLTDHENWVSEFLTPAIWNKYKNTKTSAGFSFRSCIRLGLDHKDEGPSGCFNIGIGLSIAI